MSRWVPGKLAGTEAVTFPNSGMFLANQAKLDSTCVLFTDTQT